MTIFCRPPDIKAYLHSAMTPVVQTIKCFSGLISMCDIAISCQPRDYLIGKITRESRLAHQKLLKYTPNSTIECIIPILQTSNLLKFGLHFGIEN